jgi:hypothetical protein
MAIPLNSKQVASFEELLLSQTIQLDAVTKLLYEERYLHQGGVLGGGEGRGFLNSVSGKFCLGDILNRCDKLFSAYHV